MTDRRGEDDILAQLERDVRRVIEDNSRFLARFLEDDFDLDGTDPGEAE